MGKFCNNKMINGFLILLFLIITLSIVSAGAATEPSLINTGFTADGQPMAWNSTDGFILGTTNVSTIDHLIQFAGDTVASEDLTVDYYALKLNGISDTKKNELKTYYDSRGTPEPFLTYLKNAVDGINPFAYINAEGGNSVSLVDSAKHDLIATDVDMTVPDDYPEGIYPIEGRIMNSAGSIDGPVSFKLIIDRTAPIAVITNIQDGNYLNEIITIDANATDSISGIAKVEFWYASVGDKIGEDTTEPYSMDWNTKIVSDGGHSIWAVAYDNAGNGTQSTRVDIAVDNTGPSIDSFVVNNNNLVAKDDFNIENTINDAGIGGVQCYYKINDNALNEFTCNQTALLSLSNLLEGRNTITLITRDALGNFTQDSKEILKDSDNILTVDGNTENIADFDNIGDALDYSTNGDTIYVYPGTYEQSFSITNEVNLVSAEGPITTIIHGRGEEIVRVSASNVVVDGFTIEDATDSVGIYVGQGIANITIQNSVINKMSTGIYASNVDLLTIQNNTITENGISVPNRTGIHLYGVTNSTISNNQITGNDKGIVVETIFGDGSNIDSNNIQITDNNISGNLYDGIIVDSGENILVKNNKLFDNSQSEPTTSMHNNSDGYVDARYNWWNTTTLIDIYNDTYGNVLYSPWCVDEDCNAYSIAADVNNEDLADLLTSGLFLPSDSNAQDTNYVTAQQEVVITSNKSTVTIPKDTNIMRSDGSPMDATALIADGNIESTLSGLGDGEVIEGALKWGLPDLELVFSPAIELHIFVGTDLNGQTLNIQRSTSGSDSWTSSGISPATCVVTNGYCDFNATKASYYATTSTTPSTTSNTPSGGSTTVGTPLATTTPTETPADTTTTNDSTITPNPVTPTPTDGETLPVDNTAQTEVQNNAVTGLFGLGDFGLALPIGLVLLVILGIAVVVIKKSKAK